MYKKSVASRCCQCSKSAYHQPLAAIFWPTQIETHWCIIAQLWGLYSQAGYYFPTYLPHGSNVYNVGRLYIGHLHRH